MRPEDLVVTIFHDQLSAGTVKGPASYLAEPRTELRREVGWLTSKPIELATLPRTLRTQFERPGNVIDVTGELDGLAQLLSVESETTDDTSAETQTADPRTPEALEALSQRVHLETAWLDRQVALVQRRRQIVLYGPPGTGKTYLAQALAEHLTSPDAVRLVQFHPSYSYEDFFEGFRPDKAADGSVGFVLTPGPLRTLVGQARSDPHRPYVLVIDEFNRANLAKVFGELYFLLEYRDHSIRLQYSPEESFSLPPNVYIIGTMNTADRSIARVDAAMRRRFAFVEMHPDEPPVRDLLSQWPGRIENDPRPALLRALNEAIPETDRDVKIGPSYLMDSEAEDDEGLAQVWEHDLLPLLEEHFYGRLSRAQVHQQFGLDTIRQAAEATGDDTAPADPESSAP
nr:AAA family ATPase [Glycomyces sp. L485]